MVDNVKQKGKWEFNEEVALCFCDMLSRSIPNYDVMRKLTTMLGSKFADGGLVVDVGCSNGLAVETLIENINANYLLMDISDPMLDLCRKKYHGKENVKIVKHDLREDLPFNNANLVISSLTIQFTPIEYRQRILNDIYGKIKTGGAFIFIEKVLGESFPTNEMFVNAYYDIKRMNGYSEEAIQIKKKSLEGVLVPLTYSFNKELLSQAGFKTVDCFWKCLNFCGWIAIK